MYSVQDERLDPLKRKSSSVYIVGSDNDFFFSFFWCVIQANKQFSQAFHIFFFLLLLLCRGAVCRYKVCVYVCVRGFWSWLHMKGRLSLLREYPVGIIKIKKRVKNAILQHLKRGKKNPNFLVNFSFRFLATQTDFLNRKTTKIFRHRCNLLADTLNFVYTSVHILYLGQVPKEGGR